MEQITIKQELQGTFIKVQNCINTNYLLEKRMMNFASIISQCNIVMCEIRNQCRTNDITCMIQEKYNSQEPINLLNAELNKLDELLSEWNERNSDVNYSIASIDSHIEAWNNIINSYVNEVKFIANNNIGILKTIEKLKNLNK